MKTNTNFHQNNKHKSGYDLEALCTAYPELIPFVFENKYKNKTIDFSKPAAVKALNTALLFKYYGVKFWNFPEANLCPPIPGRIDYIHYVADILKASNITKAIRVLDIGTGASCIYPLLGYTEYKWNFVATDIDKASLKCAEDIIVNNHFENAIKLRLQKDSTHILKGIINETDVFAISMCNPPFFKSEMEAVAATKRKLKGLNKLDTKVIRNFAGTHNELWYHGGEKAFIHNYLYESSLFKDQCKWFTTLVSKKDLVQGMHSSLKKLNATQVKTIDMGQGNKISRIVAWTFT